jgi:serine/threonine protein kinase
MNEQNPFFYGKYVPKQLFIGRERIIERCRDRLNRSAPGGLAISGEHGIGKTSLLYYLMRAAEQEGWGDGETRTISLFLDCQTIRPFTPFLFWRRLLEEFKESESQRSQWGMFFDRGLSRLVNSLLVRPELYVTDIQRLLRTLNKRQSFLLLWLDSFTWAIKASDNLTMVGGFLAELRSLVSSPSYPFTIVTATSRPLSVLCAEIIRDHPGSDLLNVLMTVQLKPFDSDEIDALFKQTCDRSDLQLAERDRELLLTIAGAHPALLQMAGHCLYQIRAQGPLSDDQRQQVVRDFEQQVDRLFDIFWGEATPLEQALLALVLLTDMLEHTSQPIAPGREQTHQLHERYVKELETLVERGHLKRTEEIFHFASAVFARWIAHQWYVEGEALLEKLQEIVRDESLRQILRSFMKLASQVTLDRSTYILTMRPPLPPSSGRYQYTEEDVIGRGRSSVVYKAFDTQERCTVALKLLDTDTMREPGSSRERLLKEARDAAQLKHPYIVQILDTDETGDRVSIIMEYLPGGTLADRLHKGGRVPLEEVIHLLEQPASALDYAHDRRIIHRDIKPENLLFTEDGKLKLTDFGIAKALGDPRTTEKGHTKGTVSYMSPEQIKDQPPHRHSDLFSLATVAFEMLSGSSPWAGTNVAAILDNIKEGSVPSLRELDVPNAARLDPVFQKALALNPADRYPTGLAFVQALKQAVGPEPPGSPKESAAGQPTVFISYCHEDEAWKNRLVKHLRVVGTLDLWDDRRIEAGENWRQEIREAIAAAQVAILLITVDYLNSEFIRSEEVPRLLERQDKEGLRIFPVIVGPCAWKRVKWVGRRQARPTHGEPLATKPDHEIDDTLAKLAEEVADITERTASY